jgi:Na+/H+-dicarboxylate symporter
MKNQVPAYLSAIGTQSSAATIPVNLQCAEKNGISKEIRNFLIPLCATIHMPGSMITITSCVTAVLLMYGMPLSFTMMASLIMALSIAITASPGAPGGSIMAALPFLTIVGIAPDGPIASLLIALYITQDSFGTACNVSVDNAVSPIIDKIYLKYIKSS